jgi:hypothetical protein
MTPFCGLFMVTVREPTIEIFPHMYVLCASLRKSYKFAEISITDTC